MSIDPIGFGVNWYVYALNDPINLFEWFGLEPEPFDGVITGFALIDRLLGPLGEAAWNYGYAAGEHNSRKASGWRVALERAKFSGWLGFYGFARGIVGGKVGLSTRPIRIPDGLQRYTHFITEIERYYKELPHVIKNINNARKLGLDGG